MQDASDKSSLVDSKQKEARSAYTLADSQASKLAHDKYRGAAATEHHMTSTGSYLKSIIFGGMDGVITTFAVVAGAAGGNLGSEIILIMGFSNLLADGLSMGLGDFISSKAEDDFVAAEHARETWEFENYPEGEKAEMVELYQERGYSEEDAANLVEILTRNKETFINTMMVEELGMMPPDPDSSPAKHGLVTFLSFLANGLIPLLTFVIASIVTASSGEHIDFYFLFGLTCALTALNMFGLGAVSSIFTIDPWWKAGLFTLLNGCVAAGASYLVGYIVGKIVGTEVPVH
jgi:DNA damage-binding protein 1